MKTKSILLNLGLPLILIAGYFFFSNMDHFKNPKAVAFELPAITHHSLMGHGPDPGFISSNKLSDKPLIINFWASWCEACDLETESLSGFWERYEEKVNMVAIATRDDKKKILNSKKMLSKHYNVAFDKEGVVAGELRVTALPQTLLVDSEGIVRHRIQGPATTEKLKELEKVLENMDGATPNAEGKSKFPISLAAVSPPQKLPDFELTSSHGKSFKRNNLLNKVWLANFIFTSCETTCPIIATEVNSLQSEFNQLNFVSFSVDPKNDTPEKLKEYGKKFAADESRWHFLTGQWSKIRELLLKGFKIGAPEKPVFHTDRLVLVDRQSRIRGYYSVNSKRALKRLRKDVSYLLKTKAELKP